MCAWWASHPPSATRCYGWFHTFSHHSNIYIYQSNTNILKTVEIWIWIISKNKRNLQDSNHFRLISFNPMSSFGWFLQKSHFPPDSTCRPFFFPPCFFDPRWQNPWNYVGGDKGPERHVRFTPDENSSGLDKWIDIHHHWHFETFVDTHLHIYLYINLNVNTCKSAYIIYIYLSKWPSPMMPSISIPFEGK